ncbi:9964_t:CDS:10 [Entrophospora sp. SA101]|nr:12211_t:CDS:10 [Entrophospora sp. SA101]CAJ0752292.1 9964_t:CDS:10 [Entrophospora sp. SA101]CAJ0850007.1 9276_t:CDS:10 [Entrophospora sp. SA101]
MVREQINDNTTKHFRRIINTTHMIPYDPILLSDVSDDKYQWDLKPREDHSALYSGISSLDSKWENYHVGFVGRVYENPEKNIEPSSQTDKLKASLVDTLAEKKIVPVFLDDAEHHGHYEGYCKTVLWPLFHYILWDSATDGRIEAFNWTNYVKVNQRFTEKIMEIYRPGDLGYESTQSGETSEDKYIAGTIDARDSIVTIGTFPIGIDIEKVEKERKLIDVVKKMALIQEIYADKKIIVGRDKLDLAKGVIQKLDAFENFLSLYPEWHNKVVLIQVTTPALSDSPKLERKVSELIANINGKYGSLEFTPVHHYHNNIAQDEYYALLSVADIGLITSVRDGMNTTSLEYIMCQQENHGSLILSEFTGMAGSLDASIMVNPWDYTGVAKAINDALYLSPKEKKEKHMQLYKHVTTHTAQFWADSFVEELKESIKNQEQSSIVPFLNTKSLLNKYKLSKKRLLLFDYDGTLTPIVTSPSAAAPGADTLKGLNELADDPKNKIWIISGRDTHALDKWLGGIKKIGFSAEHGGFIKSPESDEWINLMKDIDMSWKTDVLEIFTYYKERTQGSFVEHKSSSITWHYPFQAKECQNHLESAIIPKLPVEILLGKKNLEVRPTMTNKGEIVNRLLENHSDVDFVFCAGDDRTDEDMFKAIKKSHLPDDSYFCTMVGSANKKTSAGWHVNSPQDIIQTIKKMVQVGKEF